MTDVVDQNRWSNILGATRRLAKAKSSMLQENNLDAACMYVHTSFGMCSDRHVLGLLRCAGMIALCCAVLCCAVLCCARGTTAVDTQRQQYSYIQRKIEKTGENTRKIT